MKQYKEIVVKAKRQMGNEAMKQIIVWYDMVEAERFIKNNIAKTKTSSNKVNYMRTGKVEKVQNLKEVTTKFCIFKKVGVIFDILRNWSTHID